MTNDPGPGPDWGRYPGLEGRVVLVTGAARGLGAAVAAGFAAQGSRLALVDRDWRGGTEAAIVKRIPDEHLLVETVDLGDLDACQVLVGHVVDRFGRLDVLVNNAARLFRAPVEETSAAEFELTLRINLVAPFVLARTAIDVMRRQGTGGRIVNVASMAGRTGGVANVPAYAASKGGLLALTKSLAKAVAADGILVNAILPSNVSTAMLHGAFPAQAVAATLQQVPLRRAADPEEVAALVLWLASDASSYVTGVSWDINGGWYMS